MAEGSRSRLLAFAVAVHALAHRSATQRFEALRLRNGIKLNVSDGKQKAP